tara:strand:+ start:254 stop:400 length:147 start_codon:yes stop_codon:yes gene_type:complete
VANSLTNHLALRGKLTNINGPPLQKKKKVLLAANYHLLQHQGIILNSN